MGNIPVFDPALGTWSVPTATQVPPTGGKPFINIKLFATGTPADWTATIQAAIAAGVANGDAEIFFPPGTYNCGSTIVLDGLTKLSFVGASGRLGAASLVYTAATGNLFSLKSASSIQFFNLNFLYSNASYNDHLFQSGHNISGADTSYITWDRCALGGAGALLGAASCINLSLAIVCQVRNCNFTGAQRGIYGQVTGYSNAIEIHGNAFVNCELAAVASPGQSWLISNNTFEPTSTGKPSGVVCDTRSGFQARGLAFIANWYGDATALGTWNTILALGVSFSGEFVGGNGETYCSFLVGTQGIAMSGSNVFNANIVFPTGNNFCLGGSFFGNDYAGGNPYVNSGNCVPFISLGNNGGGGNFASYGFATGSGERSWGGLVEIGYKTQLPTNAVAPNSGGAVWLDSATLDANGIASFIHGSLGIIAPNLNSGEIVMLAGQAGASLKPAVVSRFGYSGGLAYSKGPDVLYEPVGVAVAAATSIALPEPITHVTGAGNVSTITPPLGFTGGRRTVIPDGAFTWDILGNIGKAGTAIVGKMIEFVYDGTKWWPSY